MRSSWLPSSTIEPSERTAMASALRTVESLCATSRTEQEPRAMSASSDCWTLASDSASKAEVASSRKRSLGSRRKARAMEMRCRCPPEILTPRSPMRVSYPLGNSTMNSSARAARAAVVTLASGTSPRTPYLMLAAIVASKSSVVWATMLQWER
mmetsp:Transcript_3846/g.11780  ORF Transcript_3846/g.11780 Transcript_3846/m.11780 type:complete len:154 (+) Transcript_3846:134-595(+)